MVSKGAIDTQHKFYQLLDDYHNNSSATNIHLKEYLQKRYKENEGLSLPSHVVIFDNLQSHLTLFFTDFHYYEVRKPLSSIHFCKEKKFFFAHFADGKRSSNVVVYKRTMPHTWYSLGAANWSGLVSAWCKLRMDEKAGCYVGTVIFITYLKQNK